MAESSKACRLLTARVTLNPSRSCFLVCFRANLGLLLTRVRSPAPLVLTMETAAAGSILLRLDLIPEVQVQEIDLPAAFTAYK